MRSEGYLKAERALAQHSERLARRAPEPDELAARLAAVAPRLERALAEDLAALLGGDRPQVTCGKVERAAAPRLHKMIDPVAVNWQFADAAGGEMLVSLGLGGALALTDMVFGGPGAVPAVLPERLPKSTDLALVRAAESVGAALARALERDAPLVLQARHDVLGKLVPARDEETFLTMRVAVVQGGGTPVDLLLMLRLSQAPRVLFDGVVSAPAVRPTPDYVAASEPFASVPLPLVAVLAEITLPVRRITALKAGDIIALPTPRDVPLRLGAREIARGQAGSADGQMALRITATGWTMKDNTNG
jgi:flagellar motor switch protein FliM